MSQEANNKSSNQPKATSTQEKNRPKVNPNKTINYRQDGADRSHRKR